MKRPLSKLQKTMLDYIQDFMNVGLNNPRTYKSRSQLKAATGKFERKTGIKWPFKQGQLINGNSCSGIVSDYNIVEFSDSCLNTNLAIETEIYSYSFKLSDYDENILYKNIVQINLESIQSILDLDNCQMVDTLTKVNEIVNIIDGTPCSN